MNKHKKNLKDIFLLLINTNPTHKKHKKVLTSSLFKIYFVQQISMQHFATFSSKGYSRILK
ncbi:hypothetical protein TYM08_P1191 [Marinicellulosiphila megalodicopiae]